MTPYIKSPTLREAYIRQTLGACSVCGLCSDRCSCRYCASCLEYWRGPTRLPRDAEAIHGITHDDCRDCLDWAAALTLTSMEQTL